ncbi:MAG: hypothetical protein JNJ85_03430 [Candidatus Kapabacteria bacterium]|nr:hypothetical protein [Candidatus Kapabacteria bacterium]
MKQIEQEVNDCNSNFGKQYQLDMLKEVHRSSKSGPTYTGNFVSPCYLFAVNFDSCSVRCMNTQLEHNGKRITFADWCRERWITDRTSPQLSAMSVTDTFQIKGGDSIKYYRELWWFIVNSSKTNAFKYWSSADISFSVELIDSENNERFTLIDSTSLQKQEYINKPKMFATNPVVGFITYKVPMFVTSAKVFIRFNVYQVGNAKENFKRFDAIGIGLSDHQLQDGWQKWKNDVFEITEEHKHKDELLDETLIACYPTITTNKSFSILLKESISTPYIITITDTQGSVLLKNKYSDYIKEIPIQLHYIGVVLINLQDTFGKTIGTSKVVLQ